MCEYSCVVLFCVKIFIASNLLGPDSVRVGYYGLDGSAHVWSYLRSICDCVLALTVILCGGSVVYGRPSASCQ